MEAGHAWSDKSWWADNDLVGEKITQHLGNIFVTDTWYFPFLNKKKILLCMGHMYSYGCSRSKIGRQFTTCHSQSLLFNTQQHNAVFSLGLYHKELVGWCLEFRIRRGITTKPPNIQTVDFYLFCLPFLTSRHWLNSAKELVWKGCRGWEEESEDSLKFRKYVVYNHLSFLLFGSLYSVKVGMLPPVVCSRNYYFLNIITICKRQS